MAEQLVFGVTLDISQFESNWQLLIDDLELLKAELMTIGAGGEPGLSAINQFMQQGEAEVGKLIARYKELQVQIKNLRAAQERLQQTGTFTAAPPPPRPGAEQPKSEQAWVQDLLAERMKESRQAATDVETILGRGLRLSANLAQRQTASFREQLGIVRQYTDIQKQAASIVTGRAQGELRAGRLNEIDALITKYQDLQTQLKTGAIDFLPKDLQRGIGQGLTAGKQLEAAQVRLASITTQRIALEKELTAARRLGDTASEAAIQNRLAGLQKESATERVNIGLLKNRKAALEATLAASVQATTRGDQLGIAEANVKALEEMKRQGGAIDFGDQADKVDEIRQQLKMLQLEEDKITKSVELQNLTEDQIATKAQRLVQIDKEREQAVRQYNEIAQRAVTAGLPSVKPVQQQFSALERVMTGAFTGFVRRFEAALQYAISGAVIYMTQRLVREFAQAAIEVERAFADIESALEFDIAAPRGTGGFDRAVESVRTQVLGLAEDFNVLPNDANEMAYVMVARFADVEDAIKATRAQLLATKVSGIDASETLRALTAVAEGFANSIVFSNETLSTQQRLLERQKIAAEQYGKALDIAVTIQQTLGTETEDVLEGMARSTEIFRQMGFSMEETAAINVAVSKQLGQTGQQAAERLNRWVASLTSPEVSGALLDLAYSSDKFNLSLADFGSGAEAWKKIANQFDRLKESAPDVANRIVQIIGQRREAESVGAALNTTDWQRQIVESLKTSTGAAEKRFAFLNATVSETLKSIGAGFQELAQNLERLGVLTPFKILLTSVDKLLQGINGLLKLFRSLAVSMNRFRFFGRGIGDIVGYVVSLGVSFVALRKAIAASVVAARVLMGIPAELVRDTGLTGAVVRTIQAAIGARKAITVQAGVIAGAAVEAHAVAPAKTAAKTGIAAVTATKLKEITKALGDFGQRFIWMLNNWIRLGAAWTAMMIKNSKLGQLLSGPWQWLVNRTKALGGAFASAFKYVTQYAGTFSLIAAAVGAAVYTFFTFRDAVKKTEQALKDLSTIPGAAAAQAQKEAAEQGLTPIQQRARQFEIELNKMRNSEEANVLSWYQTQLKEMQAYERSMGGLGQSLLGKAWAGLRALFGGSELTDNSKVWWRKKLQEAEEAFGWAQITAIRESLEKGNIPEDMKNELADRVQRLINKGLFADTPEEVTRWLAEIALVISQVDAEISTYLDEIEGTSASIQKNLDRLRTQMELGLISPQDFIEAQKDAVRQLTALSELPDLDPEKSAELIDSANQLQLKIIQDQIAAIEAMRDANVVGQDRIKVLQIELSAIGAELTVLKRGTPEWLQKRAEGHAKFLEIEQVRQQRALAIAQGAEQIALTDKAYFAAVDAELEAIDKLILNAKLRNNEDDRIALEAQEAQLNLQKVQREADSNARRAAITARSGQPVRNRLAAIAATIASLESEMNAGLMSEVEYMEANQKLNEALADQAEAEMKIWEAKVRATVGVADTLRDLQAQLVIAAQELTFAAEVYGENTEEYYNAQVAVEKLKYQVAKSTLELQILQQRLESDMTDPFQQAAIDLAETMAELSNPDLGELERARLEAQAQQQRDKLEREKYNKDLFNLKFLYETDQIGTSAYIGALRKLLAQVDTTSQQGKEIFLQIQGIIDGLTGDISGMKFNIPTEIRLPTLFEVRRALQAEQLGVNYQDNRTQEVKVYVGSNVDAEAFARDLENVLGQNFSNSTRRSAPGLAPLALGSF